MTTATETAARGALRGRLESGDVAVTAEIGPPRGAGTGAILRKAEMLRGWVDTVNLTDNQGSHVRLASWAGSLAVQAAGVEPVMQMTCRDRNRIALQSDLLGAAALGIRNVLLLTGDHPKFGDHADAKPVFDLDSVQLAWTARTMRDEGKLLSGREIDPRPDLFIGAVENPFAPPAGFRARRLGKKVAAGAEFVQTQFVFDIPAFTRWMAEVRDLSLHERCHVIAGVGTIRSLRALDYMSTSVPGVHIPPDVGARLRGVPAGRVAGEGIAVTAELIQQVLQIPGVAGVHVMAFGNERAVPEILERSGIGRRDAVGHRAGQAGGAAIPHGCPGSGAAISRGGRGGGAAISHGGPGSGGAEAVRGAEALSHGAAPVHRNAACAAIGADGLARELTPPDANAPRSGPGIVLEPWLPGRDSCIWGFNALYWQALSHWEKATGREYEQALPGGESDARNKEAVCELVGDLLRIWDDLDARRALPDELYVLELGVGNGNQARVFLDEFAEADRAHGREYYRRLHYLIGTTRHTCSRVPAGPSPTTESASTRWCWTPPGPR